MSEGYFSSSLGHSLEQTDGRKSFEAIVGETASLQDSSEVHCSKCKGGTGAKGRV